MIGQIGMVFNYLHFNHERSITCNSLSLVRRAFKEYISDYSLLDIGFQGLAIISKRGNFKEYLDRVLSNSSRQLAFPNAITIHSPLIKSNNIPL